MENLVHGPDLEILGKSSKFSDVQLKKYLLNSQMRPGSQTFGLGIY